MSPQELELCASTVTAASHIVAKNNTILICFCIKFICPCQYGPLRKTPETLQNMFACEGNRYLD